MFHVLAGAVEPTVDDGTTSLRAGELVRFDGDCELSPTAPRALVTLAKP